MKLDIILTYKPNKDYCSLTICSNRIEIFHQDEILYSDAKEKVELVKNTISAFAKGVPHTVQEIRSYE